LKRDQLVRKLIETAEKEKTGAVASKSRSGFEMRRNAIFG